MPAKNKELVISKLTDRDKTIIAQGAVERVVQLFGPNVQWLFDEQNGTAWQETFTDGVEFIIGEVLGAMEQLGLGAEVSQAVAQVQGAFPGAVDVTQGQPNWSTAVANQPPPPPPNVVQFPGGFQQPQPQAGGYAQQPQGGFVQPQQYSPPQQAPQQQGGGGASKKDAQWSSLIHEPWNWTDKRPQKRPGSNGPDFEHNSMIGENGRKVGLWLQSRYGDAPQWVFAQLQQQGRL